MEKVYNTICEDCGTVFKAKSKRAFLCPKCVKRRISESHKNKNLDWRMIAVGRYDKDIEENPYLGEHSKFTMQFARDHGITMEEAYKHPVVKAHKEDLRHLTECYKFANGNMRLN